jgi:oligopeptide transport system substrate-binding protein
VPELPAILEPARFLGEAERIAAFALFERLVSIGPSGNIAPALAESWTFEPPYRSVAFTLRKATWSDGTDILASDVVDSWLRAMSPDTAGEWAFLASDLIEGGTAYNEGRATAADVGLEADGDRRIVVRFSKVAPYALELMAHPVFSVLPMAAVRRFGSSWDDAPGIVCGGPYKVSGYSEGKRLSLAKNEEYWDADSVAVQSIEFVRVADCAEAVDRFAKGDLDWVVEPPAAECAKRSSDPSLRATVAFGVSYLALSPTRFADESERVALAEAIDRALVASALKPYPAVAADTLVPPFGSYQGKAESYGASRSATVSFEQRAIRLSYPSTSDLAATVARAIADAWEGALGVSVELSPADLKDFSNDMRSGDFDAAIVSRLDDVPDPAEFLSGFAYGAPFGAIFAEGEGAAFGDMASRALGAVGEERSSAAREAESYLLATAKVVPLWRYTRRTLFNASSWDGLDARGVNAIYDFKSLRSAR